MELFRKARYNPARNMASINLKRIEELAASPKFLVILFLIAWLPRLGLAVAMNPRNPHPYDPLYEQMASNYAAGKGLVAYEKFGPHPPFELRSFRPPMFPLAWGLLYGITGGAYMPIRVLHSFLSAFVPVIAFLLATMLFDRRSGLIAWLGCAAYPPLVWHSVHLMTEPLFILFHTLAFYCLLTLKLADISPAARAHHAVPLQLERGLLAGVFAGLATLSRSVLLGFAPVATLWILLRSRETRKNATLAVLFASGFTVVMLPWWIRNYNVHGCFVASTTDGGHGFYGGNNEAALKRATGFGWPPDWKALDGVRTEVGMDKALYAAGLRFWRENPGVVPKLMFDRFCRLWRPMPHLRLTQVWEDGEDDALPPLTARSIIMGGVYLASFLATLPIMIYGFIIAWKRFPARRAEWVLVLLLVSYTTAIHMVFQATIRYREPMWPLLFAFWAFAIAERMTKIEVKLVPQEKT